MSFAEEFELSLNNRKLEEGMTIPAVIQEIGSDYVIVNAGLKSVGRIPVHEFHEAGGKLNVGVGEYVEVEIEHFENGIGETIFSRSSVRMRKTWQNIVDAYETRSNIVGIIKDRVKGGFVVYIESIRAFLPGSLLDLMPGNDPSELFDEPLEFKIVTLSNRKKNLVVSRRAVIDENLLKNNSLAADDFELIVGNKVKGVIRGITAYGAFVEVKLGVYGYLHITDISWAMVNKVEDVLTIGDEIEVKILDIDLERRRIGLGLKQLQDDPWSHINRSHPIGSRCFGEIVKLADYGIFVQITVGVIGLVHVSEFTWTKKSNLNPQRDFEVGSEIEVMVLDVDTERRRLSLGIKQCKPSPWKEFESTYTRGDRFIGKISSITDFGLFVSLPFGIDGLLHISHLNIWEEEESKVLARYKRGDEIEVSLYQASAARERVALYPVAANETAFTEFLEAKEKGTVVDYKVIELLPHAAMVELAQNVVALLPIGEVAEKKVNAITDILQIGSTGQATILNIDNRIMKICISIKEYTRQQRKSVQKQHQEVTSEDPKTSLGDLLQEHLDNAESDNSADK